MEDDNMRQQWSRRIPYFLSAITGVVLFYLYLTASYPVFISDDYYIFTRISEAGILPVTLHPGEYFFLFLRPVAHCYYWLLYTLFDTNALLMKWFGAGVLLATVAAFFFTIEKASKRFQLGIPASIIAAACVMLAFHRDLAFTVLWISNINELLAALFYLLTLNLLLGRLSPGKLVLAVLFFLFSILSKQSGLHLPVLVFLFLFGRRKTLDASTHKRLFIAAVVMLIIAALAAGANYLLYFSRSEWALADMIFRKPLAILGTTVYMLFPLFGKSLYFYFLAHRSLALAAAAFLSAVLLLLLVRSHRLTDVFVRRALPCLLFILIIFFPRILAGGGDRLNAIQLLWLMFILSVLLSRLKNRTVQIAIVFLFLLQNAASSLALINELKGNDRSTNQLVAAIRNYRKAHSGKLYVVPSYIHSWHLPYYLHYLSTGRFGKDTDVSFSAVYVQGPFGVWYDAPVTVSRNGSILTVSTDSASPANLVVWSDGESQVLERTKSMIRGSSQIRIRLPDSLRSHHVVQLAGDSLIEK
jgi:hypothetical protein